MLLYSVLKDQNITPVIFQVTKQINHGIPPPPLVRPEMQFEVAELNCAAGSKALELADFETAHTYLNIALSLLPDDHWTSRYGFCLRLFLLRAKAAHSIGNAESACDSLKKIIKKGKCLGDKLDAYTFYVTVSLSSRQLYWLSLIHI